MSSSRTNMKINAGLRILHAGMYKFYIHLENLSMDELRRKKGIYKIFLNRKNDKGISIKFDLSLYMKEISQMNPSRLPFKMGFITFKAGNIDLFSLIFEMNIKKKCIKQREDIFIIDFKHSLKKLYEIKGQYCFTEEMLNKLRVENQSETKQISVKTQEYDKSSVEKEINARVKKEKGIKKASSSSYKKCINCHYSEKGNCGLLSVKVENNDVCKRFYTLRYRTVSGGGFSPR